MLIHCFPFLIVFTAKLLKPIQKLSTEANSHFGKIQRYGPEIYHKGGHCEDLPWHSVKALAGTIRSLKRSDLLESWDRLILPSNRSRIVSCVYGKTFPLSSTQLGSPTAGSLGLFGPSTTRVVDRFDQLVRLRKSLNAFDETVPKKRSLGSRLWNPLWQRLDTSAATAAFRRNRMFALGIGVIGFGVVSLTWASRNKKLALKR